MQHTFGAADMLVVEYLLPGDGACGLIALPPRREEAGASPVHAVLRPL